MKIAKVCRLVLTDEERKVAADAEELLNQFPDHLRINGLTMEQLREAMIAIECNDEEPIEYEESEG